MNRTSCGTTCSATTSVLWNSQKERTQEEEKKNTGWKLPKLYEKHYGSKKPRELHVGKSQRSTPRHIILILLKDGEHFGSIRKKWHFIYRRTTVRLMIGFSSDLREVKGSGTFCAHRKKNLPTNNSTSSKGILHKWREMKTFPNK